jgi:hypothetical protein
VHRGRQRLPDLPLCLAHGDLVGSEPQRAEEDVEQLAAENPHLLMVLLHHLTARNETRALISTCDKTRDRHIRTGRRMRASSERRRDTRNTPEAEVLVAGVGPYATELAAHVGSGERVPLGPHQLVEVERVRRHAVPAALARPPCRMCLHRRRPREQMCDLLLRAIHHPTRHTVAHEQEPAPLLGGARHHVGVAACHIHHRHRVAPRGLHRRVVVQARPDVRLWHAIRRPELEVGGSRGCRRGGRRHDDGWPPIALGNNLLPQAYKTPEWKVYETQAVVVI